MTQVSISRTNTNRRSFPHPRTPSGVEVGRGYSLHPTALRGRTEDTCRSCTGAYARRQLFAKAAMAASRLHVCADGAAVDAAMSCRSCWRAQITRQLTGTKEQAGQAR